MYIRIYYMHARYEGYVTGTGSPGPLFILTPVIGGNCSPLVSALITGDNFESFPCASHKSVLSVHS